MFKLTSVLQEILGAKARVAVLRHVINSPGIAARSVETKSGMSWGAIRPAVEQLNRLGVIEQDKGGWSNHLVLNNDHLLAKSLRQLFEEERKLERTLARYIKKLLAEYDQRGLESVLIDMETMNLYVVVRSSGLCKEIIKRLKEVVCFYKIKVVELSVEEFVNAVSDDRFGDLYHIAGSSPPFTSLQDRLKFFDF